MKTKKHHFKKTFINILKVFLEFFKLGLISFGGGMAMVSMLEEELVEKKKWVKKDELVDMIAISESTPGPVAINMATYVGFNMAGVFGSIFATLGVVLPSFIIILLIALLLKRFMNNRFIKGFFSGVKPIVFALILSSALVLLNDVFFAFSYDVSTNTVNYSLSYEPFLIALILLIAIIFTKQAFKKKVNVIYIIVLAAIIGIVVNYIFESVKELNLIGETISSNSQSLISLTSRLLF